MRSLLFVTRYFLKASNVYHQIRREKSHNSKEEFLIDEIRKKEFIMHQRSIVLVQSNFGHSKLHFGKKICSYKMDSLIQIVEFCTMHLIANLFFIKILLIIKRYDHCLVDCAAYLYISKDIYKKISLLYALNKFPI